MPKKFSKVAIIMRTKDRGMFLRRSVKSVLNQTYDDWKLVIVNDGGDVNDVKRVLGEFDICEKKLKIINNQKSVGMEAASNIGIKSLESNYVVIHDDDDSWEKNFLKECVDKLDENNNIKGVITHTNKIIEEIKDDDIIIKKKMDFNSELTGVIDLQELAGKNLFSPISFVYRRSVFDEIGLYDEMLPVLGDWDFNLRFIEKYDIHIIEKRLANYHHRKKIKNGVYGNTIIAGKKRHLKYEKIIRNKYLRKDFQGEGIGIGTIMNLSFKIRKSNSISALREYIKRKI